MSRAALCCRAAQACHGGEKKRAVDPRSIECMLDPPLPCRELAKDSSLAKMSWDGLSVDPRPFAKLDLKVWAETGLAGSRVIPLEKGGGDFSVEAVYNCEASTTTKREKSMLYKHDDGMAFIADDGRFERNHLSGAVVRAVPCVKTRDHLEAGFLLGPRQRRAALDFEVKQQRAKKLIRQEVQRQRREDEPLDRALHKKQERLADDEKRALHASKRTESLLEKNRLNYDPFQHDPTQRIFEDPGFLQKRRASFQKVDDTHRRLFHREDFTPHIGRQQILRDHDQYDKTFNIISHAAITYMPSSSAHATSDHTGLRPGHEDKRKLQHPSNQSLERGRNLQGSLEPRHRQPLTRP